MNRKKRKKIVTCSGCINHVILQLIDGCLARAFFTSNTVQKNSDVQGIRVCGYFNSRNNCKYKSLFNLSKLLIRLWLKKDCQKRGIQYGKKEIKKR